MFANSKSSMRYSLRWLSRISRRRNRSPGLYVSCRSTICSPTLLLPLISIGPKYASEPDGDVDLVLLVVELDVKRRDTRVGKTAIAVERLNALQIRLEGAAVEEPLSPPRKA